MKQCADNIISVGSNSHLLKSTFSRANDLFGLIDSGQNLIVHFVDQNDPVSDLMKQNLGEAHNTLNENAHIIEIDISAQPELAERMMINQNCPPEIHLFSQGNSIESLQGLHPSETLLHRIQDAFDRQQHAIQHVKHIPVIA